jgi:hypothetical protein
VKRRAVLAGALALLCESARAAGAPAAELERIERLIAAIGARQDLRFLRNGSDYPASDAARFLREKFKARSDGVTTAEGFVERIATRSSTTGRPYLIRWPDGREQAAAEFLLAELKRIAPARQ